MIKRIFLTFLFCISLLRLVSAQQVPIGNWRSHLPYRNAIGLADAGNKVYCATPLSLFYYDKADGALVRISTVSGLAEISISAIAFNEPTQTLVVGYSSGNIDLIDANGITNLPFIKDKNITGKKNINHITMKGSNALLSCGFGIVVLNLTKKEISDSYSLSPAGSTLEINDLCYDGSSFYAATMNGVYQASVSDPLIFDHSAWVRDTTIPAGVYNTIANFNGNIYANYSKYISSGNDTVYYKTDSIFVKSGAQWNYLASQESSLNHRLEVSNGKLVICNLFSASFYNSALARTDVLFDYCSDASLAMQAVQSPDGTIWIADHSCGLIKNTGPFLYETLTPNGPGNSSAWSVNSVAGITYVASGGVNNLISNNYQRDGFHVLKNDEWTSYTGTQIPQLSTYIDLMDVAADPNDSTHLFLGFWGDGLLELKSGNVISSIPQIANGVKMNVSGVAFDNDGVLWFPFSSGGGTYMGTIRTDKLFTYSIMPGVSASPGRMTIDSNGQKWVIIPRGGGLAVYSDNIPDKVKVLSTSGGSGSLPSQDIFAVAEDHDGQVWIGSSKGVAVIFSPSNVSGGGSFDAQKIMVEQDGHAQYLLETEAVKAIAVDGANRKWFGTDGSGVYLMSADGTNELLHFTKENSPLFSNSIQSISIDGNTGEVFFATDAGIISYRGTATSGEETMEKVFVFPNPVRATYSGLIGIRGLSENASVRITDISGALVYATNAYGGQAVWNGKNVNGEKAGTGVYLVYCSNRDGSETMVTKIFFIN